MYDWPDGGVIINVFSQKSLSCCQHERTKKVCSVSFTVFVQGWKGQYVMQFWRFSGVIYTVERAKMWKNQHLINSSLEAEGDVVGFAGAVYLFMNKYWTS